MSRLTWVGNVGLGRETIFQLAKHNPARIFLAARSKLKAEAAIAELKQELPDGAASIEFIELDLTSFDSIKRAVDELHARSGRLHLLFNNAGVMGNPPSTTKEGYEIHFGTNHIGHALLTKLLLPKLKKTAAENPSADVRIINVSSEAYRNTPKDVYPYSKFRGELLDISWWTRYALSKLANIHYNQVLSKRNPELICVALHPGAVSTNIAASFMQSHPWLVWPVRIIISLITVSVQEGALNQLWAATAKDVKSGAYYKPIGKEGNDDKINNPHAAEELWKWTEEQLQGFI